MVGIGIFMVGIDENYIVERELALGMKPILPAFSGYVPHAILVCFFFPSFH